MEYEILEIFDKCSIEVRKRINHEIYLSKELKDELITSIINFLKIVNDVDTI